MADIFISYSSHELAKAIALRDKLISVGLSVWIDESGISAATQWSDEIVKAIEKSKIFIILLSHNALESHNVIKELKLASEEKKHLIPIDLEIVELTSAVKYQLAGIQRVPYKDFDRIEEAIRRLISEPQEKSMEVKKTTKPRRIYSGLQLLLPFIMIGLLTAAYFLFIRKDKETTTSINSWKPQITEAKIAVLPFEFLTSNKDDEFFADGLTSEVISSLSHLQGMAVIDRKTAMEYKGKKSDSKSVASTLHVRYIVDGTIQKEGQNIKISAELYDADSAKILLTEHFEGTTEDKLQLQERLALGIAFEIQGSLSGMQMLPDTTTIKQMTTAEAYQAYSEATKSGMAYTGDGMTNSLKFLRKAVASDPKFLFAYYRIALASIVIYTNFSHAKSDLIPADSAISTLNSIAPSFSLTHYIGTLLAQAKGDHENEVLEAKAYLQIMPEDINGYYFLGNAYLAQGKTELAVTCFEEIIKRNISSLYNWNLLISCLNSLGDTVKRNRYIYQAQPLYLRYIEKHPLDAEIRIQYAYNLGCLQKNEESKKQLDIVLKYGNLLSPDYYNVACIYSLLHEPKPAFSMLRKSIQDNYVNTDRHNIYIKTPFNAENSDLDNIRDLPEFRAIVKEAANTEH